MNLVAIFCRNASYLCSQITEGRAKSLLLRCEVMKGKVIFITGATSGIGEGCARKFAAMGSNLIFEWKKCGEVGKPETGTNCPGR